MFDLELLGLPEGEGDRLFIWGRIKLGHFQDEFQVPLFDWAPGDYAAQWICLLYTSDAACLLYTSDAADE